MFYLNIRKPSMSILSVVKNNEFVVISKKLCKNCIKLKDLLNSKQISFVTICIDEYMEMYDDDDSIFNDLDQLKSKWNITSYPMTFINNEFIGDYITIEKMNAFDKFDIILKTKNINYISNTNDEF